MQIPDIQASSELLFHLFHASRRYLLVDPTAVPALPPVLDLYSTQAEINQVKESALKDLEDKTQSQTQSSGTGSGPKDSSDIDVHQLFGAQIEKSLEGHVSFTTSILEVSP